MDKVRARKAGKGLWLLVLDKVIGPVAFALVCGVALLIVLGFLVAIGDVVCYLVTGSVIDGLTPMWRYACYAAAIVCIAMLAHNAYRQRNALIDYLSKIADRNEKQQEQAALAERARKRLAEKGAYTDEARNTNRSK